MDILISEEAVEVLGNDESGIIAEIKKLLEKKGIYLVKKAELYCNMEGQLHLDVYPCRIRLAIKKSEKRKKEKQVNNFLRSYRKSDRDKHNFPQAKDQGE